MRNLNTLDKINRLDNINSIDYRTPLKYKRRGKDINFNFDNRHYKITYINSRIKNMKITVKANNDIYVSGYNLSYDQIKEFVYKYINWIDKAILKNNSRIDNINYNDYLDGKTMWLYGKEYEVCYIDDMPLKYYSIVDNKMYVSNKLTKEGLFKIVKDNNLDYLSERVNFYASIFDKIPNLVIKDMKSKYGYNRYKDNVICLSKRLIHYPKEFIDYVIVHEFCHYYVHNHSKDFYILVSEYMPNYKEILKRVKKFNLLIKY